jgi:hypothetical protein
VPHGLRISLVECLVKSTQGVSRATKCGGTRGSTGAASSSVARVFLRRSRPGPEGTPRLRPRGAAPHRALHDHKNVETPEAGIRAGLSHP